MASQDLCDLFFGEVVSRSTQSILAVPRARLTKDLVMKPAARWRGLVWMIRSRGRVMRAKRGYSPLSTNLSANFKLPREALTIVITADLFSTKNCLKRRRNGRDLQETVKSKVRLGICAITSASERDTHLAKESYRKNRLEQRS